jgi:hypothetical protein
MLDAAKIALVVAIVIVVAVLVAIVRIRAGATLRKRQSDRTPEMMGEPLP